MNPSSRTGNALAALRHLRGLSLGECATAAGLSPASVAAVEEGGGAPENVVRLAAIFGLRDAGDGEERSLLPDESSAFTVFLLHSATPTFDYADLRVFEEAMRSARIFSSMSPGAARASVNRLRFAPIPPARPLPRDAAKQGHLLAQRVRASLSNPAHPIGDLRELLEEHFGIPVLVRRLDTIELRASAVLDADRSCAAVVLSAEDDSSARNPWLTRVYLAHELCHVLFDPSRPGRVQVALDERMRGPSPGPHGLLESRAKGFAAELLLPQEGLQTLFAGEARPSDAEAAVRWVVRAAEHFQTPFDIAMWHLGNRGFFSPDLHEELRSRRRFISGPDTTSLPEPGELPIGLRDIPGVSDVWSRARLSASSPPEFVLRSRESAREAWLARANEAIAHALAEAEAGREIEATDSLVGYVDDLLLGDDLAHARVVLEQIDPETLPPSLTVALATLTAHARQALGASWENFYQRLGVALRARWGFSEARCQKLDARLLRSP